LSVALAGSSAPAIRVICGPTAAGKTFAATWFSRLADVSVVSADSRQLYRKFDIGTAKPTARDLLVAPHYGIDVLDPTERASAAWWAERADGWIDEVVASGRTPIVVGGTGLYLRALFGSLFLEPAMDAPKRAALQSAYRPRRCAGGSESSIPSAPISGERSSFAPSRLRSSPDVGSVTCTARLRTHRADAHGILSSTRDRISPLRSRRAPG
jgi:hypothetical protein